MSHPAVAGFRLSSQQERTGSQQAAGASPFWARCELIVEGLLDTAKLQDVIRGVVGRHEILRTIFCRQTGLKVPFQVILESPDFAWHSIDLTGLDEKAQREQLANLVGARESDFDLEKGPALQVVLAKLTPEKYTLALSLPALCADLHTLANLAAEIGHAYANGFDALEEVTQYADVAEWQRELLASDESKSARDYWRDYCRKIDYAALDLVLAPFERKSPGEFAPAAVVKRIKVESLGLHAGTSLPDFLLACWQVFLSRMSGRPNITVGCQFNGRSNSELATALGAFAKYLPLDSSCDGDLKFSALLAQVQRDSADFRNWQDCFSWSNTELPTSQEQGPVLPLAFEFAELPDASTFGGLRIFVGRQGVCSERFHLKLAASRQGERLELAFHFDSARLDRGTVEHWSCHFLTLLSAAAARPNTEIRRLPMLDESERQRVLIDWNQTAADYPREQCIDDLFEAQAARVPERVAVRCGEQAFTYRELNARANQLAHYLRGQGVGSDRPVGLCLERSAETMVAVLAILKAGGAYVPLNPDNPPARLLQQLAGAAAIITESKFSAQIPEFAGPTIVLDRDQKLWATEAKSNLTSNTNAENLVYVIYTSGSTGVPKGVAVRHRNLVNYADFISKRLELEKYPEGLQFATVSTLGADLGNTCIYPALISGGTVHIVGYEMATDPRQFAEYVAKHPIDVLKIVPSHLQALVNSEDAAKLLPRKYLIFGGETLTPKLVEKIAGLNPSCEILNHYGPTETTVGSLTLKLKDYDWRKSELASIPIGQPIQNTQVYVLDGNLEPVPVGVTGELYIAGVGVTAGYLGQPEKTSERFVKNPFATNGSEVGSTMYRTGDLARYGADGNIEFLGRGDDQVKIRGFRIELGEIEAVLTRHAGVKQVVVLAREDAQGEKRLLAYVVLSREQASSGSVTGEELRSYLKQQVPDYMVPQAVVVLQKLPLNANGKIDRQGLPEPEQAQTARALVAPRTATERAIAEIWEEVLRRGEGSIGIDDNFFDLGGHSLLATQVISRVRERFSVEIPMRAMFDQPLVSGLAEAVERARSVAGDGDEFGIARVAREEYRA